LAHLVPGPGGTIRVALIGYGYAGRVFHAPLISATAGLTLAVVGSRQGDAVLSVYPHAEVVPDPLVAARHPAVDLVVLATLQSAQAGVQHDGLGDVGDEPLGLHRMVGDVVALDEGPCRRRRHEGEDRLMVVVLPAPLAPSRQKISPGPMARVRESSASRPR
jgi:hypothetical protein